LFYYKKLNISSNELDRRFLISNSQSANKPIIYCNDAFCDLIGYSRADIIQKTGTCEFLYGSETSEKAAKQIRHALQGSDEKEVDIVLYKNDGKFLIGFFLLNIN
jgi:PAS domain S-box-containing protein